MKLHLGEIKNININADFPMIMLGFAVLVLTFWVVDLKNELNCYKKIGKDQCNIVYGK